MGECKDDINTYKCECPIGWTGGNCEININECDPDPCKNGGKCKDGIGTQRQIKAQNQILKIQNILGQFFCECPQGFTGSDCGINVDECDPDPCKNNGTCLDLTNGYKCHCHPGFTGPKCEININDCKVDFNEMLNWSVKIIGSKKPKAMHSR